MKRFNISDGDLMHLCSAVKENNNQGLLVILLILHCGWTQDFFTDFQ